MRILASNTIKLTALAGNACLAVAKLVAAAWTGSTAVLADGVHSIAAAASQAMIAFGARRAGRQEACFWSFVVAILLFSLGAGVAISEGVGKLLRPQALADPLFAYVVLGVGVVFQLGVTSSALRRLDRAEGSDDTALLEDRAKDPGLLTVLLEGVAGLTGSLVALAGIAATHILGWQGGDARASIGVGLVMGAVAAKMAVETKALLVDRPSMVPDDGRVNDAHDGGIPASGPVAAPPPASGPSGTVRHAAEDATPPPPATPVATPRSKVEPTKRSYPPPKPGKGKSKRR